VIVTVIVVTVLVIGGFSCGLAAAAMQASRMSTVVGRTT
jgi:thioredoxin reductase